MASFEDNEATSDESDKQSELWNILFQVKKVSPSAATYSDSDPESAPGECTELLLAYCKKHYVAPASPAGAGELNEKKMEEGDGMGLDRYGPSGFKPLHYLCSAVTITSHVA
jgi:hypothetical protein